MIVGADSNVASGGPDQEVSEGNNIGLETSGKECAFGSHPKDLFEHRLKVTDYFQGVGELKV